MFLDICNLDTIQDQAKKKQNKIGLVTPELEGLQYD